MAQCEAFVHLNRMIAAEPSSLSCSKRPDASIQLVSELRIEVKLLTEASETVY